MRALGAQPGTTARPPGRTLRRRRQSSEGDQTSSQISTPKLARSATSTATELDGNRGDLMREYRANRLQVVCFLELNTLRQTGAREEANGGGGGITDSPT